MTRWVWIAGFIFAGLLLSGCAAPQVRTDKQVLFMGDSLLAWHRLKNASVAQVLRRDLGARVVDRSMIGAGMVSRTGVGIPSQYVAGDWDWVVVNGGGNDLWLGCNCNRCDRRMRAMISPDGRQGTVPEMVDEIRQTGARVLLVGYLRSPGFGSVIEHCRDDGDELERRMQVYAQRTEGVEFLSLKTMVPEGDMSFHGPDRIHPSTKGSTAIARRIAGIIGR